MTKPAAADRNEAAANPTPLVSPSQMWRASKRTTTSAASARAPATAPAMSARSRNAFTRGTLLTRWASAARKTDARYEDVATLNAPITMPVGLSQLANRSPLALPTGTRPDAIAPTAAPSANGVSTDDAPKTRSMPVAISPLVALRAQRVGGAAQDDPDRGDQQGHRERRRDRGEHPRVRRPADNENEDQPDVIRLPDRANRVARVVAKRAVAARGRDHPDAGPKVRAGQDHVGREADEDEYQWDVIQHAAPPTGRD